MSQPILEGQRAVVTGGSGILGRAMALALAEDGARVYLGARSQASALKALEALQASPEVRARVLPLAFDVLDPASLEQAAAQVEAEGGADILVNAAGGNRPAASTAPDRDFFALDLSAVEEVMSLNFTGTLRATQAFGAGMARRQSGCIVNITSMAAVRPLTRVVGYSAAKAAVVNFTQWLAVHLAQAYGPGLRVNAIAPGFFLTEQNRYLMLKEDGGLTERAQTILAHTPQNRFGAPEDLLSTLRYLVHPQSRFVTGVVLPVDGGFSAFGGV
ncbi:SDR family NAD(P)-dependent oxidoreductase [Meiothermus granaticius]|uniref:Putative oxidoreductase UxuB n=1 Tax=Meiothermus granaticius NBRC 107808 TaxID=1227551 RepID=A0A399FAX2_9DEIN|nr:SDR family NAD(P)-dependent oxidoreductase [Meiothermus granaticius]RIH92855.1 putative oxidoreductase UxuB [Meiothermus granaticius NBRC 107808]GEM85569.1 dioxygenase [Meiothermus granaticius NBRC 107808]